MAAQYPGQFTPWKPEHNLVEMLCTHTELQTLRIRRTAEEMDTLRTNMRGVMNTLRCMYRRWNDYG